MRLTRPGSHAGKGDEDLREVAVKVDFRSTSDGHDGCRRNSQLRHGDLYLRRRSARPGPHLVQAGRVSASPGPVRGALRQAAETWIEPFETVGGGAPTNEIHVWTGDKIVIQLEKFGPSTQESTAVIATREWYDKMAED